jgi:hypothetical protein
MFQSLKDLYQRHQRWIPIAGFIFGFLFDTVMLRRIDELATLLQQAIYLVVAAVLITVELKELTQPIVVPSILTRFWKYREFLLHFMLGTLLNSYTIFYFKSASALTSFVFIILLIVLLTANEFWRFGKSQHKVHVALWSLCLISYFGSLSPILLGFVGMIPFILGGMLSILVFLLFLRLLQPILGSVPDLIRTHVIYPYVVIQIVFTGLYFAHAIPPVPLSVSYIGIFHNVEKKDGEYELTYTRPAWKFWQHGDETFLARPGDQVYGYAQIFSPARFRDQLHFRWLLWNEKNGWEPQDAIPIPIVGGREEGFRAMTKKSSYQPGKWRIQIETMDGHEVGRLTFTIEADDSTDERTLHTLVR